jgi:hypothetical protein
MYDAQQAVWDDLTYYFVIQEGDGQLSLSGHAAFAETRKTLPFDSETDAALYLLEEVRKGARASEQDIEIARAITRGDKAMFVYEEKQPDGTLLLTLHDDLPPRESSIVAFGGRSPRWLARFLLQRLHESSRVTATAETIQQAQTLLG